MNFVKLTILLIILYTYAVMSTLNSTKQKKIYTVVIIEDKDDGGFVGRCDELHTNS